MRFVCESCRAQYMISDEKVGPRGVKVRCKKCGHVIHVRRPDSEAEEAASAPAESESSAAPAEVPTEENNIFSGVDEDEIGAAFDQALGGEGMNVTNPFQPEEDTSSTRVMDEESVKRFAEMSQPGTPTPVPPPSTVPYEWFVAVNEVQTGPLTEARVKELWDRGEIGPDSLTWRQGLSDWIPLSDVGDLAALLAPRPSRPIFAPAVTPVPPSVMTVPVESAFSAGGMTRTVRSEVPVATPDTGFRPTATAALASLVKDEIDALNKPPPPKEPPAPAARSILEVPEEPVKRSGPSATAMPAVRPGPNGAPTVPTPFAYRSSTSSMPASRKGITKWLAVLGVAVVILAVGVGFLIVQTLRKPAPVAVVLPPPPPTPSLPPATPPPATPPTAVASATPAAAAPSTAKPPTTPPSLAKAPTPVPAVEASTQRRGTGSNRRNTGSKTPGQAAENQLEGPAKDTIEASHPRNKADDLFDEVFGTPDGKKAAPAGDKGKKTAYVPPAPGVTDVPEKVGDGDIMSVVLANKSSMVRCVDEQKSRDANLHGTLVMHWVIQTSGKTTNVAPVTESYKSSYFATCMTGLVKTWQFPKHRFAPGQAVDFPFKF